MTLLNLPYDILYIIIRSTEKRLKLREVSKGMKDVHDKIKIDYIRVNENICDI